MKQDERELLREIYKNEHQFVRDVIVRLGMNHKRACYLLKKWSKRGWYESGVSIDLGWLTTRGKREAASLPNEIWLTSKGICHP